MRSRLLGDVAALVLATGGLLVVTAGPASAHCGSDTHRPHEDKYHDGGIRFWSNVPIRSGPHQNCVVRGRGYPNHGIDVHCRRTPDVTWYFVRDLRLEEVGWVREVNLDTSDGGNVPQC